MTFSSWSLFFRPSIVGLLLGALSPGCDRGAAQDETSAPPVAATVVEPLPEVVKAPVVIAETTSPTASSEQSKEVSRHPELLYDVRYSPSQLTYDGVPLTANLVDSPSNARKLDDATYSTENFIFQVSAKGFIKDVSVSNEKLIDSLALEDGEDIVRRFGSAGSVKSVGWLNVYEFPDKKIRIGWNDSKKRVMSVTVFK